MSLVPAALVETSLYADDLDAMQTFYAEVLGLALLGRDADRHVFFRAGDASMLLIFRPEATLAPGGLPPHGARRPGHVAFGIAPDQLDSWRERLRSANVAIEQEVTWPRGGRSMYFRDPAGNAVELITPGVWGLPSGW